LYPRAVHVKGMVLIFQIWLTKNACNDEAHLQHTPNQHDKKSPFFINSY
jgi:hypothetical protein